jgi:chorismate mutase
VADRRRTGGTEPETPELRRLRRRIDALDRRIVSILNERAGLGREVGRAKSAAGWRAVRDADRERDVLLRVAMANGGPMPQADLLVIYRRLIAATRALEGADRRRERSEHTARTARATRPEPNGSR